MKRIIFATIGSALLLTACNNNKTEAPVANEKKDSVATVSSDNGKETKENRNRETIKHNVEAFNAHDVDGVAKDYASTFSDNGDGSGKAETNIDSLKNNYKMAFTAFPDLKGDDVKIVADGDFVMVWGKWNGTWKGDAMGQKATGKQFKLDDVDVYRLDDNGKIVEHRSIYPSYVFLENVGFKFPKKK
jgi:predicted ester cyclase